MEEDEKMRKIFLIWIDSFIAESMIVGNNDFYGAFNHWNEVPLVVDSVEQLNHIGRAMVMLKDANKLAQDHQVIL